MKREPSISKEISLFKGIHPGFVLEKKLKDRKLAKNTFAASINEFPQTLGAITKGKRDMNTPLALKIEHALGLEEGYFMTLQTFYEIKEIKRKQEAHLKPNLDKLRTILFWDTKMEKIEWMRQKQAVIERVLQRGNEEEIAEITRFYGQAAIDAVMKKED